MPWYSEVHTACFSEMKQLKGALQNFFKWFLNDITETASWIVHCKQFSNPLDISQVTASSLRGVPLLEHILCPFVPTRVLEATQSYTDGGEKGHEATAARAMTLSIFSFHSLSVCALSCQSPRRDMAASHGIRGNCVRKSVNGSSATTL